jgi:hypothetical protein
VRLRDYGGCLFPCWRHQTSLFMAEIHAVIERRAAPRRRLLKSGKIAFGGGAIDCTVRNFSNTGAALEVTSPIGIPEHFTLVLEADGAHLPCRIVWRKQSARLTSLR